MWKIGTQLSLFWIWYLRPFNQKVLVFVSSLPSRFLRFTRTRKKLCFALLCFSLCTSLLVLGINTYPVIADDLPTSTIGPGISLWGGTPTWVPAWPTPTAKPTEDNQCPGFQPYGWGTVTPASDWMYACQACITKTPMYVWDTYTPTAGPTAGPGTPTVTPEPSGTPTPGGIVLTPTPANSSDLYMSGYGGSAIPEGFVQSFDTGGHTSMYDQPSISEYIVEGADNPATVTTSWSMEIYMNSSTDCIGAGSTYWYAIENNTSVPVTASFEGVLYRTEIATITVPAGTTMRQTYAMGKPPSGAIVATISLSYPGGGRPTNPQKAGVLFGTSMFVDSGCGTNHGIRGTFSWTGGDTVTQPTATPTPTLDPKVYTNCGSVTGVDPNQLPDFTMPVPSVATTQSCVVMPGWSLDLSFIQNLIPSYSWITNLYMEEWGICFKPFTFGTMRVFGVAVDMDELVTLACFVALLRLFLRS